MSSTLKLKLLSTTILTVIFAAFVIRFNKQNNVSELQADTKQEDLAAWMQERLMDPETGEIPANIKIQEMLFAKTLPKENIASRGEALDYRLRGPNNLGGRTRAIAYDVNNLQTLIAGGVSGGLWKSTDNGNSWAMKSDLDKVHNVTALAQDTRSGKTKTWYYGTGEGNGNSAGHQGSAYLLGNGMYRSDDNGETWNVLSSTVTDEPFVVSDWSYIWNIAIDPSNSTQDEIYVAANGAIMKSLNGGKSWVKELGGSANQGFAWVQVTKTGVVYAAIGNSSGAGNVGIWRSVDGANWTNIGSGNVPSNMQRVVFDIAPSNNNLIYFLMRTPGIGSPAEPGQGTSEYSSFYKYEYVSGNGSGAGGIWSNRSANIPSNSILYYSFNSQSNYNLMVKVKPNNFNMVFIGSTNLFRSSDGFKTKNKTTQIGGYNPNFSGPQDEYRYPNHHPDNHAMVFRGNTGNEVISTTDGGIHYTANSDASSVVWEEKNNGYATAQFYTIAIDHQTKNSVIVGGAQDNGTQYTNNSNSSVGWTDPSQGDGSYCAVHNGTNIKGGGIYYMSSQNGTTYKIRMDDNANKTGSQRIDYPTTGSSYRFINPFTLHYNDNDVMYMAYYDDFTKKNTIKRHTDLGSIPLAGSRNPLSTGWTTLPSSIDGSISVLKTTRDSPKDRLYVGTTNGWLYRVENANGASPVTTRMPRITQYKTGLYISDIAVHPKDGDKLLVCYSNYNSYSIYYSEDGGDTWDGVAGNLEDELEAGFPDAALGQGKGPSVRTVAFVEGPNGMVYFAGTSTGLYATYKLNGHNTVWIEQASDVIGNAVVEKLDVRDSDALLAIATHGKGVYSAHVTNSTPGNSIEEDYLIFKNSFKTYPNPAVSETTVSFLSDNSEEFQLVVYNENAQVIKSIDIGTSSNGINEIPVSVSDLTSGVYYFNLISNTSNRSIKVIVQ